METLLKAINSNDISKVKELFSTDRQDFKNLNFFQIVESVNNDEMLCTLINMCGENFNENYQLDILNCAIIKGKSLSIIESIINLDKDCVNRIDSFDMTPLMKAVSASSEISLLQFLLANHAGINVCSNDGENPLHFVKNVEVLKFLIENGGNINCADKEGVTPMMTAIIRNREREIIFEFINNDADVNARNILGQTCLHLALSNKYDEFTINQICSKTVDYNVEDAEGLTPLCYALFIDHCPRRRHYLSYFIQELIDKGFVLNDKSFLYAIKNSNNLDLIEVVAKHVDTSCVDKDGNSVLHFSRFAEIVYMFACRGAPINHKNNAGRTPLIEAIIRNNDCEIIESLLFWGADVRSLNYLLDFREYSFSLPEPVYDLLVLYGMNVSLKNPFIQSILPRVLNLIAAGKPFFLAQQSAGILRHIFLSNENVVIPEHLRMNKRVKNLIERYEMELNKMKDESFTGDVSYYKFCLKEYKSARSQFVNKNLSKFVKKNIKKLFPTFYKEIFIKIKINIKIKKRKSLLKKLDNVRIAKRIEIKNYSNEDNTYCDYVALDYDSMFIVGSYMNERELDCLLTAAIC